MLSPASINSNGVKADSAEPKDDDILAALHLGDVAARLKVTGSPRICCRSISLRIALYIQG